MGRRAMKSRWGKVMIGLVGLLGLSMGCASVDTEPEARPKQPATNGGGAWGAASDQAKLQACYTEARAHQPDLSVHTVALFFARDGKLVFVDVELPETPQLARCLSDAILTSNAFELPGELASGVAGGGAVRIDLGPPLPVPAPRPSLAEMRERQRRATLAALKQGALRESDPMVRELLNPPPPWPTREMRAELDACHRDALIAHPGLVLHREVIYLSRGGKVLLADVNIEEIPELQRCLLERIQTWSSPLSASSSEAILSTFFIDLGAAEELPDPPVSLNAVLERRRTLLQRARELGLIAANDPLLHRFTPSPEGAPR